MKQALGMLAVRTTGQGLVEITDKVTSWLSGQGVQSGLLTLFIRHTSASLLVQENADGDVRADLQDFLKGLVPEDERLYTHVAEGPDDMPAHIRSMLTQVQLAVPVMEGRLALGTWQGVYVFEHRRAGHERQVALHLIGE